MTANRVRLYTFGNPARVFSRRPRFYQCIAQYWPGFAERIEEQGRLPKFVHQEFPWGVRGVLGYDKELCRAATHAFAKEVSRSLKLRAKQELGLQTGALARETRASPFRRARKRRKARGSGDGHSTDRRTEPDRARWAGKANDADPYFVQFLAREIRRGELSYFSFGLPFEWMATHEAGAYPRLVVSFCETLRPVHGYGGLAVIPYLNLDRSESAFAPVISLAARFRGLDVDIPRSHGIYLAGEDRIKAINWLTVVDDQHVERLGGPDALTAALGPGVQQHRYSTGVVIRGAAAAARRRAPPGTDAFLHAGRARFEADPD